MTLDCNSADPFSGLRIPLQHCDNSNCNATIFAESCDLCTLLRANRQGIVRKFVLYRFHSMNENIDGGKRGYLNFGALNSGYDHFCHETTDDRAYVRGCALVYQLTTYCPEQSISNVLEFLDDPNLVAFLVSQDVFMYRLNLSMQLQPHRKILSMPLGVNFNFYRQWRRGGEHFSFLIKFLRKQRQDERTREQTIIARDSQAYQRQAVHKQVSRALGYHFNSDNNKDASSPLLYLSDLANSKFILSPPGWGSDCYRHWEALLVGSIPLVKRTSVSIMGGLAFTPAVVYDDYSMIDEGECNDIWEKVTRAHPTQLLGAVAPAFQEFWVRVLVNRVQGHSNYMDVNTLQTRISGRRCGQNSFDSVASTLEGSRKFSSNPILNATTPREYCECACQCGLCDSNAINRSWEELDATRGFANAKGHGPAAIRNAYNGTADRRIYGGHGGDVYHAYRCNVIGDLAAVHTKCQARSQ